MDKRKSIRRRSRRRNLGPSAPKNGRPGRRRPPKRQQAASPEDTFVLGLRRMGLTVFHIPHGGYGKRSDVKYRRMGSIPGSPNILVLDEPTSGHRAIFFDVRPTDVPVSNREKQLFAKLQGLGYGVVVITDPGRGLDRAHALYPNHADFQEKLQQPIQEEEPEDDYEPEDEGEEPVEASFDGDSGATQGPTIVIDHRPGTQPDNVIDLRPKAEEPSFVDVYTGMGFRDIIADCLGWGLDRLGVAIREEEKRDKPRKSVLKALNEALGAQA